MQFDDVFKSVGDFGRYQKRVYALLLITAIPVGIHFLAQVFIAAETDHWCKNPSAGSFNCSVYDFPPGTCTNESPFVKDDPDTSVQERHCRRYKFEDDFDIFVNDSWPIVNCSDGWVYDTSQYHSTIIQDWNLVCDDANKPATSSSVFFGGVLVGSLLWGSLADHIGRKKVLFICLTIVTLVGTLAAFSPNYWSFCVMRFCIGGASMGIYLVAFVISTEIVGPKPRTFTGIVIELFFAIGYMLLAILAYFIRSWRHLELAASIPIILTFIMYPFIPESPRWLVTQQRYKEATDILKKMAEENGTVLPSEFSEPDEMASRMKIEACENYKKHTCVDLVRTPNMRKKSFNLFYNWTVNSLVYYGLSLGTSNMGINDYVAMFVSGAVEFPAVVFCLSTASRFGRGRTISFVMIAGGLACFTTLFLPKGVVLVGVAMVGKFCITSSFALIYIFSAEQFPTPVRAVGIGCCSVSARIGGIMAPQILFIGKLWEPVVPYLVFSVASISAGLLVLLLPETLNVRLPETLKDGENFKKQNSSNSDYSDVPKPETA
ncbi:organic cation transporter protein-like [Anneissia japonica]|uniref:organic cation transporter protein-like n=1 Tax=Anneissia japonica TaxID=1529436 RepID=UPI001425B102|nr:organic cation transporter protein-like [Anneissia japonica]